MRPLSILLFSFILASCNNNAKQTGEDDSTRLREMPADSSDVSIEELSKEDFYVWKVDSDQKTIQKNPRLTATSMGVDTLIIGLNEMYPNIQLDKIKLSNDTLYTEIKNSGYLTERMGSSGAELYIAQAIINLTSVPGINFVKIDFEMGSHATPDVWSKDDFKDYKEVQ
jgi:hypothetical protein